MVAKYSRNVAAAKPGHPIGDAPLREIFLLRIEHDAGLAVKELTKFGELLIGNNRGRRCQGQVSCGVSAATDAPNGGIHGEPDERHIGKTIGQLLKCRNHLGLSGFGEGVQSRGAYVDMGVEVTTRRSHSGTIGCASADSTSTANMRTSLSGSPSIASTWGATSSGICCSASIAPLRRLASSLPSSGNRPRTTPGDLWTINPVKMMLRTLRLRSLARWTQIAATASGMRDSA